MGGVAERLGHRSLPYFCFMWWFTAVWMTRHLRRSSARRRGSEARATWAASRSSLRWLANRSPRQRAIGEGGPHGAARLGLVAAVGEPAPARELGDVGERGVHAVGRARDAERADPGGVDEQRAAGHPDELAVGGRVAAAGVVLADGAGPLPLGAQQGVDERGLADARRAEHDRGPARGQVVLGERGHAVAGERGHQADLDARGDGLGGDPLALGVRRDVGLVEQHDRRRAAAPGHREVALEAAEVEVAVEARDHERHVDVRGEDLLAGEGGTVVAGAPAERGATGEDGLDDDGAVALDAGRRDPVADRRQVAGAQRLVAEAARDDRLSVARRGGEDPGDHDGRPRPGRAATRPRRTAGRRSPSPGPSRGRRGASGRVR